jgi:hypothetical protein
MTEEQPTKYMRLAAAYGAKADKKCGTPCRCKWCGWIQKIRLKKGVSIKKYCCFNCGNTGEYERFTKYDQERKGT